jgi:hypothetical protein
VGAAGRPRAGFDAALIPSTRRRAKSSFCRCQPNSSTGPSPSSTSRWIGSRGDSPPSCSSCWCSPGGSTWIGAS